VTPGVPPPRHLVELARAVSSALEPDAVLAEMTTAVADHRPDWACIIRLVDRAASGYRLAAAAGAVIYPLPSLVPFGQGLVHTVVETRQPLLVTDAGDDPRVPPHAREALRRLPIFYGVPIDAGGELVGALVLLCPAGAGPTPEDRDVVALLVGLAAVAITKARVLAESEARRRAAEALADVSRSLAQALDLPSVARRIVDSVQGLLGTESAALFAVDPDSGTLLDLAASGDVAAALGPALRMPAGTGISGQAVRERRVVVSDDLLEDPRITYAPEFRARLDAAPFRSALGIPLIAGERVLGALVVADRAGRRFGAEEVRLAQSFADQAALALERAGLFDAAQQARREAEVIAEIARGLSAALDLPTVFQRIADGARTLCGSDIAEIALREPGSDIAVIRYAAGAPSDSWREFQVEPGKGLGGQVLSTGRPARTTRYADDPGISRDYTAQVVGEGIVAAQAVPIAGEGGVAGLLYVFNRSARPFTERDETVLMRLADHAAVAIRNARAHAREQAARAEAEAGSRAKDEFLAMLGHELRNPLFAMTNALSLLGRGGAGPDEVERLRAMLDRQARMLSRLVDDLLDVSRLTSGKITLRRVPVDLERLARQTLASLAEAGRTARHAVTLSGGTTLVDGDPTRLEQVLGNLLDNALKYTPAGGQIRVTVAAEGDEAVLRVRDSGAGIPVAMLPRIFDVFVQAAPPPDRAEGGLGLGLTLVRRLVELHGGTVSAWTGGPGQGSEFVVRLSRRLAVPAPAETPRTEPEVLGQRLLIIEDNPDVRDGLRLLLELWGHQVEEAGDGQAAIRQSFAFRPATAIVDIGLPLLDGYTVARTLREAPGGGELFLIALTGYGQPSDRQRAMEAGFDAHLVKPVDPADLALVLAMAARRRAGGHVLS
jgi:signal transduction histidine kinase/CheY-like chemotaxis protein